MPSNGLLVQLDTPNKLDCRILDNVRSWLFSFDGAIGGTTETNLISVLKYKQIYEILTVVVSVGINS